MRALVKTVIRSTSIVIPTTRVAAFVATLLNVQRVRSRRDRLERIGTSQEVRGTPAELGRRGLHDGLIGSRRLGVALNAYRATPGCEVALLDLGGENLDRHLNWLSYEVGAA